MVRAAAALLPAALMLASGAASAQPLPALADIGGETVTRHPELEAKRANILRDREELERALSQYKERCAGADAGSDECAQAQRYVELRRRRQLLLTGEFNSVVESLCGCRKPSNTVQPGRGAEK